MSRFSKPNVPLVQAHLKGRRQRPSLIVLQSSFTTSLAGSAHAMAQQMHRTYAKESYHYILDEKFIYRLVPDDYQAMFAPDTKNTIGILLCDDPSALNSRWEDSQHTSMLAMLADLVAKLCLAYGIKPRLLKSDELSRWKKWRVKRRGGIVANGFLAQTYWPQDYFLTLVKANIEKYKLITK